MMAVAISAAMAAVFVPVVIRGSASWCEPIFACHDTVIVLAGQALRWPVLCDGFRTAPRHGAWRVGWARCRPEVWE